MHDELKKKLDQLTEQERWAFRRGQQARRAQQQRQQQQRVKWQQCPDCGRLPEKFKLEEVWCDSCGELSPLREVWVYRGR